jgi:hypothetical protein
MSSIVPASLTLLLLGSGCASITAGRYDVLTVRAAPPGAIVQVDGVPVGQAPLGVGIDRRRAPSVVVTAPGFQPQQCPVRLLAGGGYVAADVVLCAVLFPIGCVSFIDAGGAWNALEQPSCFVVLQPEAAAPPPAPPALPAPAPPPSPSPP